MERPKHHVTAEQDKVPLKSKLGYGLGSASEVLMASGIYYLVAPVYNICLGVSPALVGITGSIPRLWEALTDPAIGSISDNLRSPFGRRKPFIVIGAVFAALLFAAIWMIPKGWSEMTYFYYLLFGSILFYTFYAVYNIPWTAMGYESTPDYHERTRLMAYRSFFGSAGALMLPWAFALVKLDCFRDIAHGARYVGGGLAILMLVLGLMPVFFCKENKNVQVERQEKIPFIKTVKEARKNRPFTALIGVVSLMVLGLVMVGYLGMYITIYYVFKGDEKASSVIVGWSGTAYAVASIAVAPFISLISSKLGKRNTMQLFLGIAFVGCLSKWVCYTPSHPYLTLIPNALIGMGYSAMYMLCHAMMADVCDLDELQTGSRREGFHGAVYNWAMKLGITAAGFISGFLLVWVGFKQSLGAAQTPHAIFLMRFFFVLIPAVANLAAMILLYRYHITEEKAYEIRSELESRRGSNRLATSDVEEGVLQS